MITIRKAICCYVIFVYKRMDMRKVRLVFLCLMLLCMKHGFIFSNYRESDTESAGFEGSESEPGGSDTARRIVTAGGQTLLSNFVLMSFNTVINNLTGTFPWATPSLDSMIENLTHPWKWDDDGFLVNQMGHPYQGGTYFTAGRVNAFGFYQSLFFSTFGSLTWEAFFERQRSSINDVWTTVPGAASMGEILYRLYAQAINSGVPPAFAFLINPMAGFHRLVSGGWEPPDYGTSLYRFRTELGMSYAHSRASSENRGRLRPFEGPVFDAGLSIIYGNPFEQESRVPFNHFDLALSFGLNPGNYMDFRIFTDGYLFSFLPIYSSRNKMSTGLSLHMDAVSTGRPEGIYAATINMYSNALNWTIKYQHLFPTGSNVQVKFHAGFTFFGASRFYCPYYLTDHNNFGGGLNGKLFLNLNHRRLGSLEMSVFAYTMWSYPVASAIAHGTVFWLFNDIAYFFPITNRMSLGLAHSFALERGMFDNIPDIEKTNRAARVFMAWNF